MRVTGTTWCQENRGCHVTSGEPSRRPGAVRKTHAHMPGGRPSPCAASPLPRGGPAVTMNVGADQVHVEAWSSGARHSAGTSPRGQPRAAGPCLRRRRAAPLGAEFTGLSSDPLCLEEKHPGFPGSGYGSGQRRRSN